MNIFREFNVNEFPRGGLYITFVFVHNNIFTMIVLLEREGAPS